MTISILVSILLFAVVVLIVAGIKSESNKGGSPVNKNVFIYLVLFATLMMTIGGSVGIFMAMADIIAPAPYHQSFEEFSRWGAEKPLNERGNVENEKISEQDLRARYDLMVATEKERQVERAKNALIKSLGWIVIPFPVFIYFQRKLAQSQAQ